MMMFLSKEWVFIPLFSICVFFIIYIWADKVFNVIKTKSNNQKSEIVKYLDLMFVEIDHKKITILFFLLSFGIGAILFFLLWPNVIAGLLIGGIATVAMWSVPLLIVKSVYDKRSEKFVDQMVDGLTIMANGIKSGLSVPQSMERVVENLGNPISQEFNLVLSQIRLGRSIEEALAELGERIPKADVQMFVTSVNILKETGGNLGETFTTIVQTIRERQKIEKKIQAMTAQGLMQGIIITLVPLVLMAVFVVVDPSYIKPMLTTTLGLVLLFVMFLLQIIGGLTIRKIVKINV